MEITTPPQPNELELSLFGAGIGESLVLHLGAGNWMIVDSCLNETGKRAAALDYLDGLNVDVSRQVRLVVVTHWHDDHIRGISQVVQAATSAQFTCSAALRCEEFFTLVAAHDDIKLVEHSSSVSEFHEVLEILRGRSRSRFAAGPDHWASHRMVLYQDTDGNCVEVHALSPSAQTITDTKGRIAQLIPSVGNAIRRFPMFGCNDLSVVLHVKTTGPNLLLGADLERGLDEQRGWRAVIRSTQPSQNSSNYYKVAHHGSSGADLDELWTQLLTGSPLAVLTPYARGRKPLPAPEDVERIKSRAGQAYCTAYPPTMRPPRRRGVDRTMNEVARTRRATRKKPGHVRLRMPIRSESSNVAVELFNGALQL
jgi:beta-lactamase superfamily II metal-dependent hydrolase